MLGVSRLLKAPDQAHVRLDPHHFHGLLERTASCLSPTDQVAEISANDAVARELAPTVKSYERYDTWAEFTGGAPGDKLNAICMWYQLHRTGDVPRALRYIHAQLREGGHFIALTPCTDGGDYAGWAARMLGRKPAVARMSPSGLERMIRSGGFNILSCERFPRTSADILVVATKR